MPKRTSDPTYLANRRRLLADNPACHWCGQPASEADHLIEHDRGGSDDLDNMVPACKTCNARRGNRYKQAIFLRIRWGSAGTGGNQPGCEGIDCGWP